MQQQQPPPPSQSNNNGGINIRDALSILSSRAKTGGDADIIKSSSSSNNDVVPNELKKMGQTIDIVNEMEFTKSNAIGCNCAANNNDDASSSYNDVEEEKEKHEAMKLEREQRSREIQTKLRSMDVADLLKMIFTAQEERVATYKLFDE